MQWSWQLADWPEFQYLPSALAARETAFLKTGGVVIGTTRHLVEDERQDLIIELISTEALKTSEIEGELLDRASVQSSLRRQFGLQTDSRRIEPAERGIAEMLATVYRDMAAPLSDAMLFAWHRMLMRSRTDLRRVGGYRDHPEPMQILSGPIHRPRVHFEAPPSERVASEMHRFCDWFNATAPDGRPVSFAMGDRFLKRYNRGQQLPPVQVLTARDFRRVADLIAWRAPGTPLEIWGPQVAAVASYYGDWDGKTLRPKN